MPWMEGQEEAEGHGEPVQGIIGWSKNSIESFKGEPFQGEKEDNVGERGVAEKGEEQVTKSKTKANTDAKTKAKTKA